MLTRRSTSDIRLHRIASLALAFLFVAGTSREVLTAENDLPEADQILQRYIAVTGGKEAYDKIKNRVTKGTMDITGQGIKLSITVYAARPNLVYSVIESDVTGKIESGTDGNIVWENSLLRGPAIKTGKERSNALRDFTFDRLVYWDKVYEKAECVAEEVVDDKPCYKIVLTPRPLKDAEEDSAADETLTLYVDKESNLATMIKSDVVTAAGTIPVEAHLSDYKIVDGILMPHKLVTKLLNQERTTTITSIENNVELPKDLFALPEQIRALADR